MKVVVAVKRVIDYNVRVRVKPDSSGVVMDNVKMSINPFDEIAVEQALQMKEQGIASEVVVVTVGAANCQDVLRHALAMGADSAILVQSDREHEPLHIAQILHQIVSRETPSLVLLGKQAIDDDCNQTAQMLAGLLDWPQATFAAKISVADDSIEVTREVDGGSQRIRCQLPAVVSADLRLAQPRYVTLPNIMKAKAKPLTMIPLDDLDMPDLSTHVETLEVSAPAARKAGIKVSSVEELLEKLKLEAGVLA